MTTLKKILFVPVHASSLSTMVELARALEKFGLESHFILQDDYLISQQSMLEKSGFTTIKWKSTWPWQKKAFEFIERFFCYPLIGSLIETLYFLLKRGVYKGSIKEVEPELYHLINEQSYHSFVLFGDRHLGIEPLMIKLGLELGITLVVPSLMLKDDGLALFKTRKRIEFDVTKKVFFRRQFPNQYKYDEDKKRAYSYYRPLVTRLLHEYGMLSKNPWIIGGSEKVIVCVDGQKEFANALEKGVLPQNLVVTGQVAHDKIYHNLKAKSSCRPQRDIIIVALPQLAEHMVLSWEKHWEEIHFILNTLRQCEADVWVSLHPKMNRDEYRKIICKYDFHLLETPLIDCIHMANIFTCTNSSTAFWATLCGIPTVLIGFYGINMDAFDCLLGAIQVEKKEDLLTAYKSLLSDSNYFLEVSHKQKKSRDSLSPFDGKCTQRIAETIIGSPIIDRSFIDKNLDSKNNFLIDENSY